MASIPAFTKVLGQVFSRTSRGLFARRIRLACALSIAVAGSLGVATIAQADAVSAMNGWSLYGLSQDQLNAQLAGMQSAGVTLVRDDASWSQIEPNAPGPSGPSYNFSHTDTEVAALAAHDITWLPVIDYSAPWAASNPGDWRSPPANDSQYATFAAAVAARYGANGTFWAQNPGLPYQPVRMFEVWNEENGNYYWDTGPNPAAYAQLYLTTRAAIDGVQPEAQVMIGGLTDPQQGISANQFLSQMFGSVPALRGNVDAIGVHPYAWSATAVVQNVVATRTMLDALGEGSTPIDITEFGWETGNPSQEQQRAANMSQTALELANSNCGIGVLAPYDWINPAYVASGGDWGITGAGGVRPAGTAWFASLNTAAHSAQSSICPSQAAPASGSGAGSTGAGTGSGASAGGPGGTGSHPGGTSGAMPGGVSRAAILALLRRELAVTGKPGKIGRVLRAGGYTVKVAALVAGQTQLAWYWSPPRKAAASRKHAPKPVLLAVGHVSSRRAGSGKLKIRLTAAGRRLLRHSKHLRLNGKGTFRPAGTSALTAPRTLKLSR